MYRDALYLWILGVELASRDASGAYNFEVGPGFLECLCTSVLRDDAGDIFQYL